MREEKKARGRERERESRREASELTLVIGRREEVRPEQVWIRSQRKGR
jgi:hypothetical protein